jgi:hypothetical protein
MATVSSTSCLTSGGHPRVPQVSTLRPGISEPLPAADYSPKTAGAPGPRPAYYTQRVGAPGPSPLGTWDCTNPSNSRITPEISRRVPRVPRACPELAQGPRPARAALWEIWEPRLPKNRERKRTIVSCDASNRLNSLRAGRNPQARSHRPWRHRSPGPKCHGCARSLVPSP